MFSYYRRYVNTWQTHMESKQNTACSPFTLYPHKFLGLSAEINYKIQKRKSICSWKPQEKPTLEIF